MSGDTSPIRDLGYLAWQNDLSWMENQEGPKWTKAVESENKQFTRALRPLESLVKKFTKDFSEPSPHTVKRWKVTQDPFSPVQRWSRDGLSIEAWDFDLSGGWIAAAVQEKGYERFSLEVYKHKAKKYQIQRVGPFAAFLGHDLVFLGSDADHRYNSVKMLNLKNGEIKTIYETTDLKENLELRRLEDATACILKTNFSVEELGLIVDDKINWVSKGSTIIPVTRDVWIKDNKTSLGLPADEPLESISLKGEWAVTVANGIRTVWSIKDAKAVSQMFVWGEVAYDVKEPHKLNITDMRYTPYEVHTDKDPWVLSNFEAQPYICSYYNAKAPVFVAYHNSWGLQKPKGLLVTAYGAYGMPTKIGNLIKRWSPLLKSGWCIASVAVPGSGDADMAWRLSGQRENRFHAIQTFIEAVKDLQEEFSLTARETVLYGRSAGGLLVTAAVGQVPDLVGAIYIECPYVDILRTISNPFYSLSKLETHEFGIGSNPTDMISTGRWSPMERIPAEGYPELFVVARADLRDLEVYPYEVLKYITRVRGYSKGQKKLLYISADKGHFTTTVKTRAEDLALLDSWLDKNLGNKYKMNSMVPTLPKMVTKMMGGRRSTRRRRNNTMMRKNRNRNNTMMRRRRNRH
jgi:protease II